VAKVPTFHRCSHIYHNTMYTYTYTYIHIYLTHICLPFSAAPLLLLGRIHSGAPWLWRAPGGGGIGVYVWGVGVFVGIHEVWEGR
jgi:hypothetical protein